VEKTIRDQKFLYNKAGRGNVVILLHGWGSSSQSWFPVYKILKKSYTVYALDLPGFGNSPLPILPWDITDYANYLNEFIMKSSLQNVCLIGHSFGGHIALKIASENPTYLRKLVLIDSAGIRNPDGLRNLGLLLAAKVGGAAFSLPMLRNYRDSMRTKFYEGTGINDFNRASILQEIFTKVVADDVRAYLHSINIPTLIIWGNKDRTTPLAHGKIMRKLIHNASLSVLQGCSHFAYLEKPDVLSQMIRTFFS